MLGEGLRPLQRELTSAELRLLAFIAEGVNPPKLAYATFPQTGVFEPIPAGRTVFDLTALRVHAPHQDYNMNGLLSASEVRSFVIAVDGICAVEARPTAQKFVMPPGVLEIASRDIAQIIFEADAPFLMQLAWGTAVNGADIWVPFVEMQRYTSTLLTKTNGAGIADSFTAMLFVPRQYSSYSGLKTLTQAAFGVDAFATEGFANKCFLLRNVGGNDVDVVVRGSIQADVSATYGYVNDPDVGVGGGSPVTVPAGGSRVLVTSTPFTAMQIAARVASAAAAAATSTLIVEVNAQLPGGGRA